MANNKIYMNRKALLSGSKMEAKAQDNTRYHLRATSMVTNFIQIGSISCTATACPTLFPNSVKTKTWNNLLLLIISGLLCFFWCLYIYDTRISVHGYFSLFLINLFIKCEMRKMSKRSIYQLKLVILFSASLRHVTCFVYVCCLLFCLD